MKLVVVIFFTCLMQVSANSLAQRITMQKKNATITDVFEQIKLQTGYDVIWKSAQLKNTKTIDANFTNQPVTELLDRILPEQQLSYTLNEKTIVIKEAEPSLLDKLSTVISNIVRDLTVKGRVVDQEGKPLPNASIRVKGKSAVTNTNQNGEFEIKSVDEDAVLLVSYVGFKTLEIALKDAVMPLEIKLNVATGELEEVKVVYNTGYQELNKERSTGSFVRIDNELFNRAVSTNVLDRILEVTNSLRIEKNAGQVVSGNGSPISIRGFSTINANMRPLIVIDGFPYEEAGQGNSQIALNNLNPNDIESITILRDAASASIWGARSGNGVIVITTKKGRYNEKPNVSFSSNLNLTEKPRINKMHVINPMDAIEFEKKLFATGIYNDYDDTFPSSQDFSVVSPAVEIMLDARKRNKAISGYNALNDPEVLAKLADMGSHDIRDDVSKYLLQNGINQQHAFNISGGSEKMKYYTSVGYDNNIQSDKGNKNNRITLNFNNTYRPTKKLELSAYLTYSKRKIVSNAIGYSSYLPGSNPTIAPYTRLADEQGNSLHVSRIGQGYRTAYLDTASYPALLDWYYRPLDEISNNDRKNNIYSTRFGGGVNYKLISGLTLVLNSQYEKFMSNFNDYQNIDSYSARNLINRFMQKNAAGMVIYPIPRGGILDFTSAEQASWNIRGQLNFNKKWSRNEIYGILGAEASEKLYSLNKGRNYSYDSNTSTVLTTMDYSTNFPTRASSGSTGRIPSGVAIGGTLDRFTSYFANASYSFDNKYTVTASGRFDASNFFGSNANQRVTPLWSTGVSWDITKENFYSLKWLSILKIRATYGYNANMNNKATALPIARYNAANSPYHSEQYLTLSAPPNPGLSWEKIKNINLGLDYGLFNQRVSGSFEYYIKKGINLIGSRLLEPTIGFSSYTGNYANMNSKGFDFMLYTINIDNRLKWSTSFNLSYNADKITSYEIAASTQNLTSGYLSPNFVVLNKPFLKVYSYPSASLDPLNGNPRGYVNGEIVSFNQVLQSSSTGGAKPADLVYHGSATPQLFGNMVNEFKYKNISLSFNVSFQFNYYLRRSSLNYNNLFNNWGNAHRDYYLRWQSAGDELNTTVPSIPSILDNRDAFYQRSSELVIKGDHIRLNDFRTSYDLNKSTAKKMPCSKVSLFVYASNLGFILWKANNQNINPINPDNVEPLASRSLALGLNLNF